MRKLISLVSLLLITQMLLMSGQCSQTQKQDIIKEIANKRWKHSHEDNKDGMQAYRPDTYKFPPSRGRASFSLSENGTFIDFPISQRDGNDKVTGTWELEENQTIHVKLSNNQSFNLVFHSLSEDGILFLKKEYL